MIKPERLKRNHRLLFYAVMLMLTVTMTGCAAAYVTLSSDIPAFAEPVKYLSNVKISYTPFTSPFFREEYAMSLERTLRTRFHILDIKKLSKKDESATSDRFVIQPELRDDASLLKTIWFGAHALSFGTVPAIVNSDTHVTLVLTAPNGDTKTFHYAYAERYYCWLPFLFLNPDFFFIIMNGGEFYEEERAKIVDAIMTQFMTDATPFILSHSAPALSVSNQ